MAKATKKNGAPKRHIVTAKKSGYSGVGAGGVHFAYGKAEVPEGWVLEWYRERGYGIEEIIEAPANDVGDGNLDESGASGAGAPAS